MNLNLKHPKWGHIIMKLVRKKTRYRAAIYIIITFFFNSYSFIKGNVGAFI